jgi:hypothetical protein
MTYQLLAIDGSIIEEASNTNELWLKTLYFRDKQPDNNIDGMIVRNTVTKQWDYAWKFARQLREVDIG